ncbi:Z1 domain-containing protein [Dehalococcoides mccartyi]|uniref:Z1 domain-containing protein n=1 Tax=Dehalococcoides mccartyi TaxID=61435 RepID=UPI0002B765BC|nr:Z1 domain-containing protein [Dehalococcoides mccartyi]AGG05894.1 Z1 domain-containing protein [Dehalococcoides mccartyi DCMB5]
MAGTNFDLLEGMISTHINTKYPDIPPKEAVFDEEVETLRRSLAPLYSVTDEEFAEIKRKLKANIVVRMDLGVLIKNRQQHMPWLSARRESLDFFFWNRYKTYLEQVKHWNPRVTGNLSRVSDEIVDYLGDPASDSAFQRRGLVLGDVQSGKTANYTAICNKAADTGYRVIIILAGMQENLRQQTQERLDAEFSGRMSQYLLDPRQEIENVPVGVGKYGKDKQIAAFTSVTKDFDKNILQALKLSLHNVNTTALFVIKKNKSILNNLIKWLESNNFDARNAIDLPMLLIDDEADNASVNTKKEDEDPTAINDAIRRLLKLFRQASYLGITATPYANIFINPDTVTDMQGDDLFPKDFIYSLAPPTNYIGAASIFSEEARFSGVLEVLYPQEMDLFFPSNHRKELIVDELPPSMRESIAYFMLINGIRDIRGDNREHRSMMIHVSRFTDVQNQISGLVHSWVENVRSDLQNYSRLSEQESSAISNIAYLKTVWEKHNLNSKAGSEASPMSWYRFISEYLFAAVTRIDVRSVNQKSSSIGLDYYNHKDDGLRVIAVGGNSLSRGLTLEGLCVSYFYRRSQMYDTLLQMGRWFGYRPGYDDLFKIWISVEAIDWYGYITDAAEELKLEITRMRDAGQTPMEFGLKVRQDPASLIVTARNKMRSATPVKRPITVSGRLLETPRLRADTASLQQNEDSFRDFVNRLPKIGKKVTRGKITHLWEGISKDAVEQLIRDFKTHPWHLSFQGAALADFIRDCTDMTDWDVVFAEGSGETIDLQCGSSTLKVATESRIVKAIKEQISISGTKVRVGAGGVAKLGLTDDQIKEAEDKFIRINGKKHIPDSAYLKIERNPVLILHIIAVDRTKTDDKGNLRTQIDKDCTVPDYLYALGIGIPEIGDEKIAYYMVNMVELKNYFDSEEDEDE